MDRRRIRGGGLHKKVIGSQSSQLSSGSVSSVESSMIQKRKSYIDDFSEDNEEELGPPAAESTRIKRTRIEKEARTNLTLSKQLTNTQRVTERNEFLRTGISKPGSSRVSEISNQIKESNTQNTKRKAVAENSIIERNDKNAKLLDFLSMSGITLEEDERHVLHEEVVKIQQKMSQLLKSGFFKKEEVIAAFKHYIENEDYLKIALNNLEKSSDTTNFNTLTNLSLVRVLLQAPDLCPEIHVSLLEKLNESVLLADSMDKVEWARLLLQQFRFLDVVTDKEAFINSIEQLLESSPPWFLKEFILYLPDIVADKHHQVTAQILNKVWEENPDLTDPILSCTSSLSLAKEFMDEHRSKALDYLKRSIKISAIPTIVHFVLEECTNVETFKKTFLALRNADIQPVPNESAEECFKIQLHIIKTLEMELFVSKDMINAILVGIKDIDKDPKPLDVILLLLVFSASSPKKKVVEELFRQRIKSGFYRASLLNLLYNDYKLVVQELHPAALNLSSRLLQSTERVFIDFAINWFRLQFQSYDKALFKQRRILQQIIFLMGKNEKNAKNALTLLCQMVAKDEDKQCLGPHCNELRVLLEKVDNFDLEEVGMLYDLLHSLCANSSSISESLQDDLNILMQKQLCAFKTDIKSKGVLNAVMAIKHLMTKEDSLRQASNLFQTTQNHVRKCVRSKALFYDELTEAIVQSTSINSEFLQMIRDFIKQEFMDKYMTDREDDEFSPQYGLNTHPNGREEEQDKALSFGDDNYGAIIPISFKLLRVCCEESDLSVVKPLFGVPILMPQDLDISEPRVLNSIIYCINWFREGINAFIEQTDPLVIKQILQRLDKLIHLQKEFASSVVFAPDGYQPPACYFHVIPVPAFVKTEKKSTKKGKKDKQKKDSPKKSDDRQERMSLKYNTALYARNSLYFRKFEPKIARLLNVRLELHPSATSAQSISMPQVCFIVNELLMLLKHNFNETFIKDLIHSLPVICAKLKDIVTDLREDRNQIENKEGVWLLLQLLTEIFDWKGFESVTYNTLLRDGLRTLAGQANEANTSLRSCKELVAESYKYFESLADIVTEISLAVALVNICSTVMKHSETYLTQNKEHHAKIAYSLLCLDWQDDNHLSVEYKKAVTVLLNHWIDNEPDPLKIVTEIMNWLPEEAAKLTNPKDCIDKLTSITKSIFPIFYRKLFDGLIKGVKVALPLAKTDPERVAIWHSAALNVKSLAQISKSLPVRSNLLTFLKYTPLLLRVFLSHGMVILEHNLKYQTEDVTGIVKFMQTGTRYLHTICCDATEKKDSNLTKYVPAAKLILEQMIYRVKGMLVLNNSPAAFWMGNLVNKNLDGEKILSQNQSEESSMQSDLPTTDGGSVTSQILDSDLNESNDSLLVSEDES